MKLPQTIELTKEEVFRALADYISKHKIPSQPVQDVTMSATYNNDGSVTVRFDPWTVQ